MACQPAQVLKSLLYSPTRAFQLGAENPTRLYMLPRVSLPLSPYLPASGSSPIPRLSNTIIMHLLNSSNSPFHYWFLHKRLKPYTFKLKYTSSAKLLSIVYHISLRMSFCMSLILFLVIGIIRVERNVHGQAFPVLTLNRRRFQAGVPQKNA